MNRKRTICTLEAIRRRLEKEIDSALWYEVNKDIDAAIEALKANEWIPCSERLPEEREWIGTKAFGTTISDEVLVTFDVDGTRFVKPLSLQNGKLSRPDAQTMDVFHKGWKMLAWMPLPEPYKESNNV